MNESKNEIVESLYKLADKSLTEESRCTIVISCDANNQWELILDTESLETAVEGLSRFQARLNEYFDDQDEG
jgi:hypothetical protein